MLAATATLLVESLPTEREQVLVVGSLACATSHAVGAMGFNGAMPAHDDHPGPLREQLRRSLHVRLTLAEASEIVAAFDVDDSGTIGNFNPLQLSQYGPDFDDSSTV